MLERLAACVADINEEYGLEIDLDTVAEIYGDSVVESLASAQEDTLRNIAYLISREFGEDVSDICNRFAPILLYDTDEFAEKVSALIDDMGEDYVDVMGEDMSCWEALL
jgi:hypothetical protein